MRRFVLLLALALVACQSAPPVAARPSAKTTHAIEVSASATPVPAQRPDLSESVYEVMGVSADEAWVVTTRRVMRVTNAGDTWTDRTPPPIVSGASKPGALRRFGHSLWLTSWSGDGLERLFRSTDDGVSWTDAGSFPGLGGYVTGADSQHLWLLVGRGAAAGSSGLDVYASRNAGVTWTRIAWTDPINQTGNLPFGCNKGAASFGSAATGWIGISCAGGVPHLLKTADGGYSWQEVNVLAGLSPGGFVTEPVFFGELNGVVVAINGLEHFLTTTDGGRTWTDRAQLNRSGDAEILSPTTWYAREQGQLKLTVDSGRTWTTLGLSLIHI